MKRMAFALKALPGMRDQADEAIRGMTGEILKYAEECGIGNFSIWAVEDRIFGYGEYPDDFTPDMNAWNSFGERLSGCAQLLCPPGSMEMMYHDFGIVRDDKSQIRHRVFVTKLKPGCRDEYKRRHDELVKARGDVVKDGPESNFSIWHGDGHIFGYCEKVKAFDHEMTEAEKASTIAWETRGLEIMDWLTDDVDWITGEKHESIRRLV